MAVTMRLARHGAKKRPFYHVVVADSRSARNGQYIEKVGTYNPMLPKDANRATLVVDRVQYWLKVGAQPTDRVRHILFAANLGPKPEQSVRPKKSAPKAKAQERLKMQAEASAAAAEAKAAPAPAPAAEAAEAPAEA